MASRLVSSLLDMTAASRQNRAPRGGRLSIHCGIFLFATACVAAAPGSARAEPGEADKLKVAVMDIKLSENMPRELTGTLTSAVTGAIEDTGAFKGISSEDIRQMLGFEKQKALLGCEDQVSCLAEVGGALGADFLVAGGVVLLEDTYLIQLQLIRIAQSKVETRVSREYKGGPMGLTKDLQVAAQILVRDVLATRQGRLLVTSNEEGATVKVDNAIVGVTPMRAPVSVAQGMHEVVVEKQEFVQFRQDVLVQRDQAALVEALLVPSLEFVNAYTAHATTFRTLAWTTSGLGAGSLLTAVALFAWNSARVSSYNRDREEYQAQPRPALGRDLNDRAASINLVSTAVLVIAAAAVAAGGGATYFWLAGDPPDRYRSPTVGGASSSASVPATGAITGWSE